MSSRAATRTRGKTSVSRTAVMTLGAQTRSDALFVLLLTCAATGIALYDLLLLALLAH